MNKVSRTLFYWNAFG